MAVNFNDTTPAAPSGYINVKWQSDTSNNASAYLPVAASSVSASVGITVDGGGSAPATGVKGFIQLPYAATITGWSVIADVAGTMSMDIWRAASSAPPSAPAVPTSGGKISASAPVTIASSAQSASGGSSAISTWTTALAQWDVLGFSLSAAATLTRITVEIFITKN